jgi:HD superfamily phosphodiesterase
LSGATYVLEVVRRNIEERVVTVGFHAVDITREASILHDLGLLREVGEHASLGAQQ